VSIFTLLSPFLVAAALLLAAVAIFCVFWCALALPFRFAFGRNWPVATLVGAFTCFVAAALAMILVPEKALALYHAVGSVLNTA